MINVQGHNVGINFKNNKTGIAGYLHGVQSYSSRSTINSYSIFDSGRTSVASVEEGGEVILTITRVISNYSDDTSKVFGPLLHYIFAVSDNKYNIASGPSSYKQSYFLNNFGYANVTPANRIANFDIGVVIKDGVYHESSSGFVDGNIYQSCKLVALEYSLDSLSVFTETSTFICKSKDVLPTAFPKSQVTMEVIDATNKILKLISSDTFNMGLSIIPPSVQSNYISSDVVNDKKIHGIKQITMSLAIQYTYLDDVGIVRGITNSSELWQWCTVGIPLGVDTSISIVASNDYHSNNITKYLNDNNQIRYVFQTVNHNPSITANNYLVFDLGKKNIIRGFDQSLPESNGLLEVTVKYSNTNNDFCTYFANHTNFNTIEQQLEKY